MSPAPWYLMTAPNQKLGPEPTEKVLARIRSGEIPERAMCWRDGMPGWAPVKDQPELAAAFATPAPEPEPEPGIGLDLDAGSDEGPSCSFDLQAEPAAQPLAQPQPGIQPPQPEPGVQQLPQPGIQPPQPEPGVQQLPAPPPQQQQQAPAPKPASSFDVFELFVALLLGLAALGGAWAGHQSSLWGGTSATAYGEAANQTTVASTLFQLGVSIANRDAAVDIEAKQLVVGMLTAKTEEDELKNRYLATYLYCKQLSEDAYAALGLPPEYYMGDDEMLDAFPVEALVAALDAELGEEYYDVVLADGLQGFEESNAKFEEGRGANVNGDQFGLAVVLFTIALFFGGLALVFKSKVKWLFFLAGLVLFGLAADYMRKLPYAGTGIPTPEAVVADSTGV